MKVILKQFRASVKKFMGAIKPRRNATAKLVEECGEFVETPTPDEAADVYFELLQYYDTLSKTDKRIFKTKFNHRCAKHRNK